VNLEERPAIGETALEIRLNRKADAAGTTEVKVRVENLPVMPILEAIIERIIRDRSLRRAGKSSDPSVRHPTPVPLRRLRSEAEIAGDEAAPQSTPSGTLNESFSERGREPIARSWW